MRAKRTQNVPIVRAKYSRDLSVSCDNLTIFFEKKQTKRVFIPPPYASACVQPVGSPYQTFFRILQSRTRVNSERPFYLCLYNPLARIQRTRITHKTKEEQLLSKWRSRCEANFEYHPSYSRGSH